MRGTNMLVLCQQEMCRAMDIYLKSLSPHDMHETSTVVSVKGAKGRFFIELRQDVKGTPDRDPRISETEETKENL